MALMVLDLPEGDAAVFPGEPGRDDLQVASSAHLAIVHGDPRQRAVLDALPALSQSTGAYLVGGLVSGNVTAPLVGAPDAPSGLAGILLADRVPVATGLTQGCSPVGPAHTVTAMEDQIILELDGQSALEVLKADVGELLARDLRQLAGYVHAAIPVSGSDTADYLVRNLIGLDAESGSLAVAEDLEVGDRLIFVRRDAASAVEDMQRMLDDLKRRAGPNQFGDGAKKLGMIAETFGDIPVIGFSATAKSPMTVSIPIPACSRCFLRLTPVDSRLRYTP
jgi:small ligand-binding sensory domain FIST